MSIYCHMPPVYHVFLTTVTGSDKVLIEKLYHSDLQNPFSITQFNGKNVLEYQRLSKGLYPVSKYKKRLEWIGFKQRKARNTMTAEHETTKGFKVLIAMIRKLSSSQHFPGDIPVHNLSSFIRI